MATKKPRTSVVTANESERIEAVAAMLAHRELFKARSRQRSLNPNAALPTEYAELRKSISLFTEVARERFRATAPQYVPGSLVTFAPHLGDGSHQADHPNWDFFLLQDQTLADIVSDSGKTEEEILAFVLDTCSPNNIDAVSQALQRTRTKLKLGVAVGHIETALDAIIELVPMASIGKKFRKGRKRGTVGPVRKALRAAIKKNPALTTRKLWEDVESRLTGKGWTAYDTAEFGEYLEGPNAGDNVKYSTFAPYATEERNAYKAKMAKKIGG